MKEMRSMQFGLSLLIAAVLAAGLSIGTASAADADSQPLAEKKVTLEVSQMPVIDAIDLLFKDTGYKYTIEPGVSGNITVSLKDLSFEQALKALMNATGLQYEVKAGRYVISPKPKETSRSEASVSAKKTEPPEIGNAEQPQMDLPAPPEGPIFYGNLYTPPITPYYDIGTLRAYVLPPFTRVIITNGYQHIEAPQILPPPGLISPSLQRMLDQMRAVHSYPGYPGPYFWGY